MIDASSSIIFALDPHGRILRWNRAAAHLTGMSEDELVGRLFHETALFPDNGRHWKREFERINSSGAPGVFESWWRIHDSSLAPIACSCAPICGSSGGIDYIICTATRSLSCDFAADRAAELRGISRYLHDTVAQELVAASFAVAGFEAAASNALLRADFETAARALERCCSYVRVISSVLAPPSVDAEALHISIEEMAALVGDETGMSVTLNLEPVSGTISAEAHLLLLAVVKCWIGRAIRGRANPAVAVRLKSCSGGAVLALEMAPPLPGLEDGWETMRERARALGGCFSIERDSQRASVLLSLPGFEKQ